MTGVKDTIHKTGISSDGKCDHNEVDEYFQHLPIMFERIMEHWDIDPISNFSCASEMQCNILRLL